MKKYLFILLTVLVSCTPKEEPTISDNVSSYQEYLVYSDSVQYLMLCAHTWTGITLAQTNPENVNTKPWRVPTRKEFDILRALSVDNSYSERFLCYDEDKGFYYTGYLDGSGSITKAGTKTKYSIRPVRTIRTPKDTIINL